MKHYIIAKFNNKVANKVQTIKEAKELFEPLTEMEGIESVKVWSNLIDRPNRYDIMIEIEMRSKTLATYDACEIHKKWKTEYGKLLEGKVIFDKE